MKQYLNVKDAARMLCISTSHLYRLICYDKRPCYHLGRRVLFDPEVLQAWVEAQAAGGKS